MTQNAKFLNHFPRTIFTSGLFRLTIAANGSRLMPHQYAGGGRMILAY